LNRNRVLVYGYGNPGRQDDGLGPACAERVDSERPPGVVTDSNYQLQVEDALAVSQCDTVIFVDASSTGVEPFSYTELEPSNETTFTTHAVSPSSVLALCRDMYGKSTRAYLLAIRGYGWEFGANLTPAAEKNLEEAHRFLKKKIHELTNAAPRRGPLRARNRSFATSLKIYC